MKKFADLWWLVLIVTVVVWFFFSSALSDMEQFRKADGSASGLFSYFMHGLVWDLGYVGRQEEAYHKLVSRAILWQNAFRFCVVALLVAGGAKFYFRRQARLAEVTK